MRLWFKSGAWASKKARKTVEKLKPDDITSIAVIRHAAVGDMIVARPFLVELRRFFTRATITLSICSNYTRAAPVDLVDRVHTVYGSDKRDISLSMQYKRVRELGYHDLLFDLAATPRSFVTCFLNQALLKIGFPYRLIQRYLYYDITVPRSDFRLETENLLDMLNIFGHGQQYPLQYAMHPAPIERSLPYILYFHSASTLDKCWPEKNFIQLIRLMSEQYPQYEHIVLKGVEEWERIDNILAALQDLKNVKGVELINCEGKLSDIKGVSLINGASLLVGNDTGIRHVAIACDTPTVGIFTITPVFRYWPRCGRHEAVFCHDGSVPDIDAVFTAAKKLMDCG